ncbi:thermonuclease family protein [Chelativorans sp.]|uniref:thermonuclease family protein n=1 Tax=Chelativorans sp. TaxID=2203393 RepID=UPI002810E76A|nr:thermonuclease family protein [Chelativorans sp.]
MFTLAATTVITCLHLGTVDGDTFKCNGENMRLLGPGQPNKSGIDTPEIGNAKCQAERFLGEQAKRRLDELLREDVTIEDSGVRDRYRRPLVWVRMPNGEDVGEVLLREGYALPWRPGKRVSWCG